MENTLNEIIEAERPKWREVTREELLAFVASRPELVRTVATIAFPSVTLWRAGNDPPLARVIWNTDAKGMAGYDGRPDSYQIRVDA